MNKSKLISALEAIVNAKRIYRDSAADFVLTHPQTMPDLIEVVFDVDSPLHIKGAWTLELVCIANLPLMLPHASFFIENMHKISHESSLRPVSKVCYFICKSHFSTDNEDFVLSDKSIDQIIECNFDWLIEEHKVATQAFAMDTLESCGSQHEWVKEELKLILQKKTTSGSKGYQAHARKILKNL